MESRTQSLPGSQTIGGSVVHPLIIPRIGRLGNRTGRICPSIDLNNLVIQHDQQAPVLEDEGVNNQ